MKYYVKIFTIFIIFVISKTTYDVVYKETRIDKMMTHHKSQSIDCVMINNERVKELLLVFNEDAKSHGLDLECHLYSIDFIEIDHIIKYDVLGLTSKRTSTNEIGGILLDYTLLSDDDKFKYVLYHELGHWFGLNHSKSNPIMNKTYSDERLKSVFDDWDSSLSIFFKEIELNQK